MGRKKKYETEIEALAAKKQKDKDRYLSKKEEIKKKLKANGGNEKSLEYYHKNRNELILKKREYYLNNKEKFKLYNTEYRKKNKDKVKINKTSYQLNRRRTDSFFKFKNNLSSLIRISLKSKNYIKKSKTLDILGCDYNEFKTYLESKFESWMSWDNYGNPKDNIYELNKTWDIDHITPLAQAKTEEDVIRLNHYTNLQPLCSYTNRFIKNNKLDVLK